MKTVLTHIARLAVAAALCAAVSACSVNEGPGASFPTYTSSAASAASAGSIMDY